MGRARTSSSSNKQDKKVHYGTGRRKTSIARVRITSGSGVITVNGRTLTDYFPRKTSTRLVEQPLIEVDLLNQFDVNASVEGGGINSQAGAIRLGVARALLKYELASLSEGVSSEEETIDLPIRQALKKRGYITRDSRQKERKKVGLHGARRRPQYSKR